MARTQLEYKGHSIDAEAHDDGKGYRWTYLIDGTTYREMKDRSLPSEEIVLREAIDAAKAEIDRMAS